jgi:hypothetical protein
MKRKTLEKAILAMLADFPDSARFDVLAHELWRDGQDWSSNDRWYIARDADKAGVIQAARGRWGVFRANYHSRARVRDIQDIGWGGDLFLEVDSLPFLDIIERGEA